MQFRLNRLAPGFDDLAAIGTDFVGGFGTEQTPLDLDTIADLPPLTDLRKRRRHNTYAIEGVQIGNWQRFFRHKLYSPRVLLSKARGFWI